MHPGDSTGGFSWLSAAAGENLPTPARVYLRGETNSEVCIILACAMRWRRQLSHLRTAKLSSLGDLVTQFLLLRIILL